MNQGTFMAGMAKLDITPDPTIGQMQLNGYGGRKAKPATGVLDQLYLRALVVSNDKGQKLAIVSGDLCYIHSTIVKEVTKLLEPHGYKSGSVILAATHTHSSFANYDRGFIARKFFGEFDESVQSALITNLVTVVMMADRAMEPAILEVAEKNVDGLNRSRLDPAFDVEVGGQPTSAPDPVKYPVDKRMLAIKITSKQTGKPLGLVFHFAAHPTVLSFKNFMFSADWPGVTCAQVETELGDNTVAMFLNGTLGDSAPKPDWAETVEEEIEQTKLYGQEVAKEVISLSSNMEPLKNNHIQTASVVRDFPHAYVRGLFSAKMPRFISKATYAESTVEFTAARLGQLLFLTMPGEPTNKVGLMSENQCPDGSRCIIVAPANGYRSYFTTKQEFMDGTYASHACFLGPEGAEKIRDALTDAIRLEEAGETE